MSKKKNKGGRPSEFTAEKIKKLEEACSMDCSIDEICLIADITPQTYYNWKEKHPQFFERLDLLRANPVRKARTTVLNAIEYDPDMALKYLERKRKDEFSPRSEITGKDGSEVFSAINVNIG